MFILYYAWWIPSKPSINIVRRPAGHLYFNEPKTKVVINQPTIKAHTFEGEQ